MPAYKPPGNPVGTTPTEFKTPPDARDTGGEYPNQYIKKTSSGHVLIMDDTLGSEHITMQHRSGSMVQFTPDGRITFIAQSGQYSVIFGENRMLITGAHDVVVEGMASMKVKGDYNTTVQGNYNMVVHGDMNMTMKNLNQTVRGDYHMTAKEMTMKMEGSSEISSHGITNLSSDGGLALTSTGDSIAMGAGKTIAVKAKSDIKVQSSGATHIKSAGAMNLQTSAKLSLKGSTIAADGSGGAPNILLASGASVAAEAAAIEFKTPTSPNRET